MIKVGDEVRLKNIKRVCPSIRGKIGVVTKVFKKGECIAKDGVSYLCELRVELKTGIVRAIPCRERNLEMTERVVFT